MNRRRSQSITSLISCLLVECVVVILLLGISVGSVLALQEQAPLTLDSVGLTLEVKVALATGHYI